MNKYAKAIVAALTAGLGSLGTALADDTVTRVEWVGVGLALLGALGIVYLVPNKSAVKAE